jgi:C1A family cysteine protease
VLDQGNCGSSWAFSTAGVASDRLRIHSNGVHNETLSPQHFISCNNDHGQHGCGSGHVDRAWWFMRKVGVVNLQCFPYTSGNSKTSKNCPLPRTYAALKKATCPEKGAKLKVYQASPPYKIAPNEQQIMAEIIKNGPVQAVMEVKEDFYMYKTGVYRHSLPAEYQSASQRQAHFHSVRLLGWGTDESDQERPLKYWLCANSWGTDWGEDGFFRIQRGTNESGIESAILAVWLKANERMLVQKRDHHNTEPERPHPKIRHHNNRDNAF